MADLIERSAALRVIFDNVGKPATEIYQLVRELQPAEAVEVVHCWECRKGRHDPMNACIWCEGKRRTAKHYCADGERKA